MNPTDSTLSVYFDGLCLLCSREIDHYRKQQGGEALQFIDITKPEFNAVALGLDPMQVHKIMHVQNSDGVLHTRVDAFIAIWERLPKYHKFARLARLKWVRPILDLGYEAFALIRPYLPRRKENCETSPYCETRSNP